MAAKRKTQKKKHLGISTTEFTKQAKTLDVSTGTLTDALQRASLTTPLIFLGTDQTRMQRSIQWLFETIQDALSGSAVQRVNLRGGELTNKVKTEQACREIQNRDLFAPYKLVVIYAADSVRAAYAKPLQEALEKTDTNTLAILTGENISQQTPLLNYAKKDATIVTFEALSSRDVARWIEREIRAAGCEAGIDSDARDFLMRHFGSDITALTNELGKAILHAERDQTITLEHVKHLNVTSPEFNTTELMQQLAVGDHLHIKKLVDNLLEHGMHPLQISFALSRSTRALLAAKSMPQGERSPDDWLLRKLGKRVQDIPQNKLVANLQRLSELDMALKGSPLPDAMELECALRDIAS